MTLSLTITRSALSLSNLVITSTPGGTFWLPEDGVEAPEFAYRLTYFPESEDEEGKQLRSAVRDISGLPLTIYTQAASAAALATNKAVLTAALGQWSYTTTLDVNGASAAYSSDPTHPRWGVIDSGMAAVHMARASVVIPVNPPTA